MSDFRSLPNSSEPDLISPEQRISGETVKYQSSSMEPEVVWRFESLGPSESLMLVHNESLLFTSRDRIVCALDLSTGKEKWRFISNYGAIWLISAIQELVYAACETGKILALDHASGRVIWQITVQKGPLNFAMGIFGGNIYVSTCECKVIAYDASTGDYNWQFTAGGIVEAVKQGVNRTCCISCQNGVVYSLDMESGREIWRFKTQIPEHRLQSSVSVQSPQLKVDGKIAYIGGWGEPGVCYAVDAATGAMIWRRNTSLNNPVTFLGTLDRKLFVTPTGYSCLVALDVDTGGEEWRFAWGCTNRSVSGANGLAYFGNYDGGVFALETDTGLMRWSASTDRNWVFTPQLVAKTVYTTTDNGNAFAFDCSTGRKLWSFSIEAPSDDHRCLPLIFTNEVFFTGSGERGVFSVRYPR